SVSSKQVTVQHPRGAVHGPGSRFKAQRGASGRIRTRVTAGSDHRYRSLTCQPLAPPHDRTMNLDTGLTRRTIHRGSANKPDLLRGKMDGGSGSSMEVLAAGSSRS